MIKLGNKVKCKVTGFTGIVIAKCEFLNGCVQLGVKPRMKAGETVLPDAIYIDIDQLDVVGAGVEIKKKPVGGPMSDVPPNSYRG